MQHVHQVELPNPQSLQMLLQGKFAMCQVETKTDVFTELFILFYLFYFFCEFWSIAAKRNTQSKQFRKATY